MLGFYQRLAYRLQPFKAVFLLLFAAAAVSFGWLLFSPAKTDTEQWQLSSVLLAVVSLLLWLLATVFTSQLPAIEQVSGFSQRLKLRLQYAWYYFLAIVITLILLATAYLGLRVLKGIIAVLFFG